MDPKSRPNAGSAPMEEQPVDPVDLMRTSLDESADGDALARAAHYSRFHFQRVFRRLTGESPGGCRRRLVLERAAYHLLHGERSVTEIAFESGFDSLEGFSRAFRKVAGLAPTRFRGDARMQASGWYFQSPNHIHYDPVVGAAIRLGRGGRKGVTMDLNDILVQHDLWLTRTFLEKAGALTDAQLDKPLKGFDNPICYVGDERTLRELLFRLVFTKERWMDSIHGRKESVDIDKSIPGMRKRLDAAFGEFAALARKVRDENLWETGFLDISCDPTETFTYGEMIAHVLTFSAYRRTVVIEALEQFGVTDLGAGDPIVWHRAQRGAG